MTLEIPDLVTFRLHKSTPDIDVDGVPVPGLRGEFYRRERGSRTESIGVYSYRHRVFIAWGYVGEPHCRHHAVRRPDGGWQRPRTGCPQVRVLRAAAGTRVIGLRVTGSESELVVGPDWAPGSPAPRAPDLVPVP